jgi:hypothetical protein
MSTGPPSLVKPQGFVRLATVLGSGAAGDALFALALAGSLFFSVPTAEARGRVALYLGLTVAPFAVVAPFLSLVLDRHRGSLRWAMVVSTLGRALLAWWLATRLHSLLLFPIAFGVLVLSRASLVVRGALLPNLVPSDNELVSANASLSKITALAGIAAGLPGLALIKWPGVRYELLLASLVYVFGAVAAIRLPAGKGGRPPKERVAARAVARSQPIRQAVFVATSMRFLVGFLIFHLAFALRRENFGSLGLGLLIGAAAAGGLVGAILAPRVRRRLREEGILAAGLILTGIVALIVGRYFSVVSAGLIVFVLSVSSGASKVAFDAIVQRETPEAARGWAFARFESVLQLAWVAGSLAPLLIPIPAAGGVFALGVVANVMAIIYVIGRQRLRPRAANGT